MKKIILKITVGFFALLILLSLAGYFFSQEILTVDNGPVKAAVLVVLGGGSHERPLRAAELFKQQEAPRIIISGKGDDEINRQILLRAGIPARVIQVEGNSRTTQENAEFTAQLLHSEKIHDAIIVTSWYHSRRALKTFQHVAPDIKFYSRPSYFAFQRKDWSRTITRYVYWEYAKLPGYWICHGIYPF